MSLKGRFPTSKERSRLAALEDRMDVKEAQEALKAKGRRISCKELRKKLDL
jgi:hypothetical protein